MRNYWNCFIGLPKCLLQLPKYWLNDGTVIFNKLSFYIRNIDLALQFLKCLGQLKCLLPLTLEHRPILRGGSKNEKYYHTPNFSSIGQLKAELLNFVPNFDHIFGPSSETLGLIPTKLRMYLLTIWGGGVHTNFQLPRFKIVEGVLSRRNNIFSLLYRVIDASLWYF